MHFVWGGKTKKGMPETNPGGKKVVKKLSSFLILCVCLSVCVCVREELKQALQTLTPE